MACEQQGQCEQNNRAPHVRRVVAGEADQSGPGQTLVVEATKAGGDHHHAVFVHDAARWRRWRRGRRRLAGFGLASVGMLDA